MVKKLSTLVLAGLLALPAAALAIDEDEFEELQEQVELSSRFQWSGDIRTRLDYHSADTGEYYRATDIGNGMYDFVGVFSDFNAAFGALTPAQQAALGAATLGDLFAGTAAPDALAGLGALSVNPDLAAMLAVMPSLNANDPTQTFGAVAVSFGGLFGGGINALDPQAVADFMKTLSREDRVNAFAALGYNPQAAATYENDTLWTTRMRLNMRVKATENVEVKARLVAYKTWGMQDSVIPEVNENGIHDTDSPYFLYSRSFDGTSGRQPVDNKLVLDRAFMNWNNIGGMPVWFSIGRRPTTDGPPAQLRLGADKRMATPINYMDYPFDGISLGYAYNDLFGLTGGPGRIRFCYGRGFEAGPNAENTGINDVDFAGFNWDIYKKDSRFVNIQVFGAFNLFNVPGDTFFPNPLELALAQQGLAAGTLYFDPTGNNYRSSADDSVILENTYLDRENMGNVYHTSAVFMDKFADLNYFVVGGWSRSDAKATDELGITLLGDFWAAPKTKDGYSAYVGVRYDLDDMGLKFGAEYNYGSKNWLAFTPGHDDIYASKLGARGSAYELYTIFDLPYAGEAVSKFGKAFVRVGVQYVDYEYTYSNMWLGTPTKIDDIKNDPLAAQFYAPIDEMTQVYISMEAYF